MRDRHRWVAPLALIAALAGAAGAESPAATVDDLAWMAGYWVRDAGGGRRVEELWLPPAGGLMLGLHRDTAPGRRPFFENLRIDEDAEGVPTYWASPGGGEPVPFRLVEHGDRHAVFANPAHDFPRRITYRLAADGTLHARVEGGTEDRVAEWSWTRAPAPWPESP